MKLKNLLLCAAAALGLSAGGAAAATIGTLDFTAGVVLTPNTLGSATSLTFFTVDENSVVTGNTVRTGAEPTGVFAGIPAGEIIQAPNGLDFANPGGVFLSYGEYEFTLNDVVSIFRNEDEDGNVVFLNILGSGTIKNGVTFPATFFLSTQGVADENGVTTISGTITAEPGDVPETGSALLLLGLGLISAETLRRRLRA